MSKKALKHLASDLYLLGLLPPVVGHLADPIRNTAVPWQLCSPTVLPQREFI